MVPPVPHRRRRKTGLLWLEACSSHACPGLNTHGLGAPGAGTDHPVRVVVVGATGNVGTSLVSALALDESVTSILGLARRPPADGRAKVEWAAADVRSSDLARLFRGADAVVHLAWLIQPSHDEPHMRRTNVGGSARVFDAVAQAGVPALVYASSVGAYAAGPSDRAVDESWPATGIPSSFYSRHKAMVERLLDRFEAEHHPDVRCVRLRPGLVFKHGAAAEIKRYFIGRLVPAGMLRRDRLPLVPLPRGLRVQAVHADDLADAYARAVVGDVRGAFNIAADPVLGPEELGRSLDARPITVPVRAARAALAAAWHLRLQPTAPGWLDLGLGVPVMDTTRALRELRWTPTMSSVDALRELVDGIPQHGREPTAALSV
jgi:UDP-glucose 4-epimerase